MTTAGDGNGGIIGKNNPTAATPPTNPLAGGAPGVWNVGDVHLARLRSEWPIYEKPAIEATGGTIYDFADPSVPTGKSRIHIFTSTSALDITAVNVPGASVTWHIAGGGGGGGGGLQPHPYSIYGYGGYGGGGAYKTGSFTASVGPIPITVGAAGGGGSTQGGGGGGGTTTFGLPTPQVAPGGGGGGYGGGGAGSPGASGGGGGGTSVTSGGAGGAGTAGLGNPGSPGSGPSPYNGGGGGGYSQPGALGGAGITVPLLGPGGGSTTFSQGPPGGYGSGGTGGYGNGTPGSTGVLIVKYPIATGV
jgi:hypothetical protein